MSGDDAIVVVRGKFRGVDPNYACMMHDAKEQRYGMVHFKDGKVSKREILPFSERSKVEDITMNGNFRGTVYVDDRDSKDLLPLKYGDSCRSVDFATFRRAKSDNEKSAIDQLNRYTKNFINSKSVSSDKTFRGAAQSNDVTKDYKTAFEKKEFEGFTQYRGGLRDAMGRTSDLSYIVPKDDAWTRRMERVYKGLDAVKSNLKVGALVTDLNGVFAQHLDAVDDVQLGNVLHQTGFEGIEDIPFRRVEEHDVVKIGCVIGDATTNEHAIVFDEVVPMDLSVAEKIDAFRGTVIPSDSNEFRHQMETYKAVMPNVIKTSFDYRGATKEIEAAMSDAFWTKRNSSCTFGDVVDQMTRNYRGTANRGSANRGSTNRGTANTAPIERRDSSMFRHAPVYDTPKPQARKDTFAPAPAPRPLTDDELRAKLMNM